MMTMMMMTTQWAQRRRGTDGATQIPPALYPLFYHHSHHHHHVRDAISMRTRGLVGGGVSAATIMGSSSLHFCRAVLVEQTPVGCCSHEVAHPPEPVAAFLLQP